ncbi:putative bifunctional diguanylate cyclase/phosphodiesterase [Nakamurella lactea]|uniref:putative bifunctional diguanylate cyclase/phosphodiesterase n=1 Tax=Nakamurella lactea TaxID=459515 RepID=UPI00040126A7|nr:EAL domain-containing protein [Nakamurella lactea]
MDALPQLICEVPPDGSEGRLNLAWRSYAGSAAPADEGWLGWVHPDDRPGIAALLAAAQRDGGAAERDGRLRHRSGEYRWHSIVLQPSRSEDSTVPGWYVICTDVHSRVVQQRALADRVSVRDDMLDASVDCIKMISTDGRLTHLNMSGCLALGLPADETEFGMKWLDLLPQVVRRRGRRALNIARSGTGSRFPGLSKVPGRPPQYWDNILTPLKNSAGETTGILCVSREVTVQREAERRLRVAGETDSLTGLLNRRAFQLRLNQLVRKARESGGEVGLMLIDLDHFKHVNDTVGHTAGDHLLRVLARRLAAWAPGSGAVARLGGDEFAVALGGVGGAAGVVDAAEQVGRLTQTPISYGGRLINGGMSIGCAVFPGDARDPQGLMKCADTALHDLRGESRGGHRMYSSAMAESAERATGQLRLARQIVRDNAVESRYRTRVGLADGRIVGLTALLHHRTSESGGQVPGAVAAAFEDYQLATQLGRRMQEKVFDDLASWRGQGLAPVPVTVSATLVEFLRDDYAERLLSGLDEFRIPPTLLQVQIGEQILVQRGADYAIRALRAMREAGVRVVLDGFGVGPSSLADLEHYTVDVLTIDPTFVARMMRERSALAIVRAIAQLGPQLSLTVVAKGIATEEQREALVGVGCRTGEGPLFGPSLSGDQVAVALA